MAVLSFNTFNLFFFPLLQYFDDGKEKKLATIRSSQCLLSATHLSRLHGFIPKDGVGYIIQNIGRGSLLDNFTW